jgi:hypothetical protein
MFEYEVVPVVVPRGAGGSTAMDEWRDLQAALNECGRRASGWSPSRTVKRAAR